MEDFATARWATCPRSGQELGLFAVCDGHGGARAAEFVSQRLLDAIASHELFPADLPGALVSSFEAVDAQYLEEGMRHAAEVAAQRAAAESAAGAGAGTAAANAAEVAAQRAAAAAESAAGAGAGTAAANAAEVAAQRAAAATESAAGAGAGTAAANAAACTASPRAGGGGNATPPPPPPPPRGNGYYYYYGAGGARYPGASTPAANGGGLVTAAAAPPGEDGSTAVVAVLLADGTLAIANVGDSRAVLMRGGRAHTLSVDHKPNVREERLRIEKGGGAVVWSGVWRVGVGNGGGLGGGGGGGGGLLALSRAFGDRPLKLGAGVVATPDVRVTRLGEHDEILVLASDGAFDVLTGQEVLMIARDAAGCASAAARAVADEALARGSMDNVAVVVIKVRGAFAGGGGAAAAAR
jgi:serine/threonine protein phosphatase PrpC